MFVEKTKHNYKLIMNDERSLVWTRISFKFQENTSLRLAERSEHLNVGATGTVTLDLIVRTEAAVLWKIRKISQKNKEKNRHFW